VIDEVLARNPAARADLTDGNSVAIFLAALQLIGAEGQFVLLLSRADDELADPGVVAFLLGELLKIDSERAAPLAARAIADMADPDAATTLLAELLKANREMAAPPAARAIADADLTDSGAVATLLGVLRAAGAEDEVAALAARSPATHGDLADPLGVAGLLRELQEAGAKGEVDVLLARDPATHVDMIDYKALDILRSQLRTTDAKDAVMTLERRLADAGCLPEVLAPYGREADGQPTAPWTWTDLVGDGPPSDQA
jgi:hypothetical protein